jgi:type VI secretion system protein ImpM
MPSVDKVGRHFPLTVAVALGPEPANGTAFEAAQSWYAQLEHVALSALGLDSVPEDLERQLGALPFPSRTIGEALASTPVKDIAGWWRGPTAKPINFRVDAPSSLGAALAATADYMFAEHSPGKALWWCEDHASRSLEVHCSNGLPAPEYFAVLLAGNARSAAAHA